MSKVLFTACQLCGKNINQEQMLGAIFVSVVERVLLNPYQPIYRGEGPFHADCGKEFDRVNNGLTPNEDMNQN